MHPSRTACATCARVRRSVAPRRSAGLSARTPARCTRSAGVTNCTSERPADRVHRAGVLALKPADLGGATERLTRAQVAHAVREGCIRLSPHCYNTREEVLRALAVMVGEDD